MLDLTAFCTKLSSGDRTRVAQAMIAQLKEFDVKSSQNVVSYLSNLSESDFDEAQFTAIRQYFVTVTSIVKKRGLDKSEYSRLISDYVVQMDLTLEERQKSLGPKKQLESSKQGRSTVDEKNAFWMGECHE